MMMVMMSNVLLTNYFFVLVFALYSTDAASNDVSKYFCTNSNVQIRAKSANVQIQTLIFKFCVYSSTPSVE